MKLFKLYTENKNYDEVVKLARMYFPDGFTITKAEGFYDDKHEHSLVIDVVTDRDHHVYDLAWDVMKMNDQKTVLVLDAPYGVKLMR